jgi:flavin-dependent dehydrogenase
VVKTPKDERMQTTGDDRYVIDDGSSIAVIGGGPTGSFFSAFALKMAKIVGKEISVTIYDPKDFTRDGPAGCNRCGGIISELLVQTLAVEGINLPDAVVQRGINSYELHTNYGTVQIETPAFDKTIATVYRGGGPKGIIGKDKESFDKFLLDQAVSEGAVHVPCRIDGVKYKYGKPVLFSKEKAVHEADLVVGAFGVNSQTTKIFEEVGFGYRAPSVVTAAIAEIGMDRDLLTERFGSSIHLFLLPIKNIKFAALIPKETYITVCILGKGMTTHTVNEFLDNPIVKAVLPTDIPYQLSCRCLPKMNVGAPRKPFADRIVACGDAGSTRLFKDGLGAAYIMGKAAAKTAVFEGVSERHFRESYYPVYRSIITDNYYGSLLYSVIGVYRSWSFLTRAMLNVVKKEQKSSRKEKILSSILWDMFTGNERYRNIFMNSLKIRMHADMWEGLIQGLIRSEP